MAGIWAKVDPLWRDLWLNRFVAAVWVPRRARTALLRATTRHCVHDTAIIRPSGFLGAWDGLTIGSGTFINYGCFFELGAPTALGANCAVGYEAIFITSTHEMGPSSGRAAAVVNRPITIGNGVWIGARAVILPGVTIGDGAVIAAGAVVNKDCAPDGLYAGVPARLVRLLDA